VSSRPRLLGAAALLLAIGFAIGSATGGTLALFTGTTSNSGNSFAAQHIFPGTRTTSAWTIRDAAGGNTVTINDDALSYAGDGLIKSTTNWTTTFASTRYQEFDYDGVNPAGISVTEATFNFDFLPNAGGETACIYFEVRVASTGSVLGTHGSSGSPLACATGTTYTQTSTSILSEVTSTDIANDLRIRVFGKETNGKPMKIDRATVTVTTANTTRTMYEKVWAEAADGSAATTNWAVATSGDSVNYATVSNWATTFNTARYVKFAFPTDWIPSGSTITAVTFKNSYKGANSGDTACWYFEVYDGTTLIGTHGSTTVPVSCNATTSFVTDSVTLNEVTTASTLDNLTVKMFLKNSGNHKSNHDLIELDATYSLS